MMKIQINPHQLLVYNIATWVNSNFLESLYYQQLCKVQDLKV